MIEESIISALNLAQSLANETGITHKIIADRDGIKVFRINDSGEALEIIRTIKKPVQDGQ